MPTRRKSTDKTNDRTDDRMNDTMGEKNRGARESKRDWTEHLARAADAFAEEMRGAVPDEFSKHAKGSMKEALLALRSLLDRGIESLEGAESKPKARKVPVD